jgi:L-aminopeptidase/D-esterase-like protein
MAAAAFTPSGKPRAAALGLVFDGQPGPWNAITDVPGVAVGYCTLIEGAGPLRVGHGPVRTGVTAILPRPVDKLHLPVRAGYFSLNGNGELTGSHFIEETGSFALPVTITNTHSCGVTRDATIRWAVRNLPAAYQDAFALPVAAETYDGFLNDINGFHVTAEHAMTAIDAAASGPVEEGSVGGGTGMKCFGFKAGSGTASRRVSHNGQTYTVGVFVQANFGARHDFVVLGHPVGATMSAPTPVEHAPAGDLSSIIAVVATDAPLLPHQLKRLARRVSFGVGRTGGIARHGSGDIFLAFSTSDPAVPVAPIEDAQIDPFFEAVVQATEESILNSLIANADMTGRDGNFVPAVPHAALQAALGING